MAAAAYNLKKLINFKTIKYAEIAMKITNANLKSTVLNKISMFVDFILVFLNYRKPKLIY
jgi:hypothetical protein